jgi:hypothetical protein
MQEITLLLGSTLNAHLIHFCSAFLSLSILHQYPNRKETHCSNTYITLIAFSGKSQEDSLLCGQYALFLRPFSRFGLREREREREREIERKRKKAIKRDAQ